MEDEASIIRDKVDPSNKRCVFFTLKIIGDAEGGCSRTSKLVYVGEYR